MTPRVCLHRFMHWDATREETVLLLDVVEIWRPQRLICLVHLLRADGAVERLEVTPDVARRVADSAVLDQCSVVVLNPSTQVGSLVLL